MEKTDSLKDFYKKAWDTLNEGNEVEALELFEQLAEQGYSDAMIDAADIIVKREKEEEFKKAFGYYLKASETTPEAYDRLCMCYWFGHGVVRSYAETVRYGLLTINEVPADKITPCVYEILGECYKSGLGVNKDVCKAKEFLENAKENGLEEEVKESLNELSSRYPFTENNEIDLKKRKRSKWATLLLWGTVLTSGMRAYTQWVNIEQEVWPILYGVLVLDCLLTLCWQKLGGYLLLVVPIIGMGCAISAIWMADDTTQMMCVTNGMTLIWSSLLILLTLQKRRYGHALAWYSLMKKRDDGRSSFKRMADKILLYGYGPKFLSDSPQTRKVRILNICYMVLALILAFFAAWGIIGQDFDIAIEWNCFESPGLYGTLCVIGFFLQFTKKLYTHASYETYDVYKDQYGKVKKVEKNQDVLEVIMGSFLWPVLSHLILIPMLLGAFLYYLIMIGFSLIQGIMPYVFGAFILFSVWLMYPISKKLLPRKYRVALISLTTMMFLFFYGLIMEATGIEEKIWSAFKSVDFTFVSKGTANNSPLNHPSTQWDTFVTTTANGIKAYKEPSTKNLTLCVATENVDSDAPTTMFCWSDRKSDRKWAVRPWTSEKDAILPVIEEADNWYKVQIEFEWGSVKPTFAYLEKAKCKELSPEPITPEILAKQSGVLYHVVKSGEMKNLCVMNDLSNFEMDGNQLRIGELKNGCLSYISPAVWLYVYKFANGEPLDIDFKEEDNRATITFNNTRSYAMEDYGASALDVRKLTNDEIKSIVDSGIFYLQSSAIKVCYYFPSARNGLVQFSLMSETLQ